MACRGSSCYQGRRPCTTPEKFGLFNEQPLYTPEDVFSWIPGPVLAIVATVILALVLGGTHLLASWPRLVTWFAP